MSERLTDEELTRLMSDAEDMHSMYWIAAVSELRERRAQDPSTDELSKLASMVDELIESDEAYWCNDPATLYIKRLIAAAEARRG